MMRNASELADILSTTQSPQKALGQHFLTDQRVLQRIAELAGLESGDAERHILEIGAGAGALTALLLSHRHRVTTIEIEASAAAHIARVFADEISAGSLTLIEGDALQQIWPQDIVEVVANIPYQISSPLIEILRKHQIQSCLLMLQDEFARRLAGVDGPASRGPLWVSAGLDWHIELHDRVSPSSFRPQPKIYSRLVSLKARSLLAQADVLAEFTQHDLGAPSARTIRAISAASFQQRRKKLRNSLSRLPAKLRGRSGWDDQRWKAALDTALRTECSEIGDARPESLEMSQWLLLAAVLERSRIV